MSMSNAMAYMGLPCGLVMPRSPSCVIGAAGGARMDMADSFLPVEFRGDHVDAPQHRDHVTDRVALDHLGEDLIVDVAARARPHAPGDVLPRTHNVIAQLPVR